MLVVMCVVGRMFWVNLFICLICYVWLNDKYGVMCGYV